MLRPLISNKDINDWIILFESLLQDCLDLLVIKIKSGLLSKLLQIMFTVARLWFYFCNTCTLYEEECLFKNATRIKFICSTYLNIHN